ncbi:MFS transporter [Luteococcus peritonei]|uniref:MFS transporter n=1 Tax=Luteococcus peritonei TaxID=88874 RepID=A0ABW4RU99_9ACTN
MTAPPTARTWRQVAAGTLLVAVTYGMARFGVGLSAPQVIQDGVSDQAGIGYTSSLSYLTYVVACLACSWLVSRGRWRLCLGLGAGCLLLGYTVTALANGSAAFLAGVSVAGAAAGFASGAIAHRLARDVPARLEARAQGIANAGTGTGVVLATTAMFASGSWRTLFWLSAALGAVATLWFVLGSGARRDGDQDGTQAPEQPGRADQLVLPVLLTAGMGAGAAVFWAYGRELVGEQLRLQDTSSLLFWGLVGFAGVAGSLSGDIAGRLGPARAWALLCTLLGLAVISLPLASQPWQAMVLGALFGGCYTTLCGITIELARLAWPQAVGAGSSILFATIAVGQTAGSLASGLAASQTGLAPLFITGGVVALMAGAPALLLHRRSA